MKVTGKHIMTGFRPKDGLYFCIVLEADFDDNSKTLLDLGIELTHKGALEWCMAAAEAEGWKEGNSSPPDAVDRGEIAHGA